MPLLVACWTVWRGGKRVRVEGREGGRERQRGREGERETERDRERDMWW